MFTLLKKVIKLNEPEVSKLDGAKVFVLEPELFVFEPKTEPV